MSNTVFATSTIKHLGQLIADAPSVVPNLNLFAQIQQSPRDPEQSAEIPVITDAGTVQTADFNYLQSDVVIDNLPAAPTKFVLPFSVDASAMQAMGLTVRSLINAAVAKFEASVWDTVIAPLFAETNFSVATGTAAAAFNAGDFETLLASVTGRERSVVIDGDYAVKIKSDWLPASGTTRILECSRWTTAGADVKGLVAADRRGIVVQVGLPNVSQARTLTREIVTLPGLGIPTELTIWHNNSTKGDHACLIAYVSAAVCDASALKLLKSLS